MSINVCILGVSYGMYVSKKDIFIVNLFLQLVYFATDAMVCFFVY